MNIYNFKTSYGQMSLVWSSEGDIPKVSKIILPKKNIKGENHVEEINPPQKIKKLAENILSSLEGKKVEFSLSQLNLEELTPFQNIVLVDTLFNLARGEVDTYKGIAKKIGNRKSARAVARALATNPFSIILPCHRIIRSDGFIGRYGGGTEMKIKMLKMEGVQIDSKNRLKK